MSVLFERPWLRRLALALIAVVTLGGVSAGLSSPANARVWVTVGVPWVGYYAPPPAYYYYPPAYPVYYRHRHHSWCYYHPYRCW